MHSARTPIAMLVTLGAFLGACATRSPSDYDAALESRVVRASPTTLTKTELLAADQGRDLYDTLRRLRPTFLFSQGTAPTVALNGVLVGSTNILRTINVQDVRSVRLLSALDATTRFGARHSGAVLMVDLRP